MEYLDFLSSSPSFYIFQKKTNKIKFGGILFLIYFIIMFFISFIYILDFALNEKIDIQTFISYVFLGITDNTGKNLNKLPDVPVDFNIRIYSELPYKWKIKTLEEEYVPGEKGFYFSKNLSDIIGKSYEIIYQCENSDCSDLYNINGGIMVFIKIFMLIIIILLQFNLMVIGQE